MKRLAEQMEFPVDERTLAVAARFRSQPLRRAVEEIAAIGPRAIDYVDQAPVLAVLARVTPVRGIFGEVREYGWLPAACKIREGRSLRAVLEAGLVPYQLRRLAPRAVEQNGVASLFRPWFRCGVSSSALAQMIPASATAQARWVCHIIAWGWVADDMPDRPAEVEWAGRVLGAWKTDRCPGHRFYDAAQIGHVADCVYRGGVSFAARGVDFERALAIADDWRRDLQAGAAEGDDLDEAIVLGPLPREAVDGDLTFVALTTRRALIEEGRAMHHCVASYWPAVKRGTCRIYAVRRGGTPVATVEISRGVTLGRPSFWSVAQVRAACNGAAPKDVAAATRRFVEALYAPGVVPGAAA